MMRKIFTITAAVLSTLLSSCGDDCPVPDDPETPILFQTDPNSLLFGSDDPDAQAIFVAAMNVSWKAEVDASAQEWLKISEESKRISVRVEENITEQPRTGTITITPDNETLSPAVITVTQSPSETIRIPMYLGVWAFSGDKHECGIANYAITLGGGDSEFDPDTDQIVMKEGYVLILDVLTDQISHDDYKTIEVKTATYNGSMNPADEWFEYEEWSFIRTARKDEAGTTSYSGSWLLHYTDGVCDDNIVLTGGKIVVEQEGDNYTLLADLVSERQQRIIVEYSGPFDAIKSLVSSSTYMSDLDISEFSRGVLSFWGEKQASPGTFNWVIVLVAEEPEKEVELNIWLYSPQTDSVFLDSGDYTIHRSSPFGVFTVEAGDFVWGWPVATWIYDYDNEDNIIVSAPLIEGTVSITHNDKNNYTIQVEAYMDNYYQLTVSHTGDLNYVNYTATGFKGVPYKMDNSGIPDLKIPDRNDRSVRYSLKNLN